MWHRRRPFRYFSRKMWFIICHSILFFLSFGCCRRHHHHRRCLSERTLLGHCLLRPEIIIIILWWIYSNELNVQQVVENINTFCVWRRQWLTPSHSADERGVVAFKWLELVALASHLNCTCCHHNFNAMLHVPAIVAPAIVTRFKLKIKLMMPDLCSQKPEIFPLSHSKKHIQ